MVCAFFQTPPKQLNKQFLPGNTRYGHAAMASTCSIPVEQAEESIRKTGIYYLEDFQIGDRVAEFNGKGLPTKTAYGLEFCAHNSLDNQNIRTIVESILDRPCWGCIKIYSDALPDDFAVFFNNPSFYQKSATKAPALLIQLWAPGSRIVFYEGAHIQNIDPRELEEWGLLSLPRLQMNRGDIREVEVVMKKGGLAIIDSRLGFTPLSGYCVNIGFVSEFEISFWAKMELPDEQVLRAKVEDLKHRNFRTNFSFVRKTDGT
ncbi:hypothetical protein B0H66DRAFT_570731 [Apodospora peruviana]|uniref:Uncharacterized protein n=1 Tax=Apodospora peruviana TaxID=516989 RepID=A0AAE0HTN0_9PEZI|nr:hypothetical protein B0H66DRAFT_570731 [Apodospora peruviana]